MKEKFAFLIDTYDMKYNKLVFDTDESGSFLGPMYAHCFYNENGVFVIYYAVQRNEWYFYKSDKYSTNQKDLLKEDISDKVYELIRSTKSICFSEISKLSSRLKKELLKSPMLFGILLKQRSL